LFWDIYHTHTNVCTQAARRVKKKNVVGFEVVSVKSVAHGHSCSRSKNQVLIHFVRHGEGYHNVAQREWRADPKWDGESEPYTMDNDPDGRYEDPLLTPTGKAQAIELQKDTKTLNPDIMIVSPLRRATVRLHCYSLSLSLCLSLSLSLHMEIFTTHTHTHRKLDSSHLRNMSNIEDFE
jgi:hypothetical protein